MNRFRFRKQDRLLRQAEFEAVYRRRRSAADGLLLVYGRQNQLQRTRLGVSVPRKVGAAVIRNRWKRCIREAFRLASPELPMGVDLVVIPRPGVVPTTPRLGESLRRLSRRVARKLERETA